MSSDLPATTLANRSTRRILAQHTGIPSDNDILCGRGKIHTKHPGNQAFAKIVQENCEAYKRATSRVDKGIVVSSVVKFVRSNGMRFLAFDPKTDRYDELSPERTHIKVSHAIRDTIKQMQKRTSRFEKASFFLSRADNKPLISSGSGDLGKFDVTRGDTQSNPNDQAFMPAGKQKRAIVEGEMILKQEPDASVSSDTASNKTDFCFGKVYDGICSPAVENRGFPFPYSSYIFDLGGIVEDNPDIQQVPFEDDMLSSLTVSPLSSTDRDLMGDSILPMMGPEPEHVPSARITPQFPNPTVGVNIAEWRMASEGDRAARSSLEGFGDYPAPLPIDAPADFTAEDLRRLVATVLDWSIDSPLSTSAEMP